MPINQTGRRTPPHESPSWIDPAAHDYFITICCAARDLNQLCTPEHSAVLLSSARVYYELGKWHPSLFLLMPDHLHMLVRFGREQDMTKVIHNWKRFIATKLGISWQRDFFEHRLRADESRTEKAAYILENTVRAGLVADSSAWPHVLRID